MRKSFIAIATIVLTSAPPEMVRAQDASFGCKVLLCAAASNPGWQAIGYCVPVMQQLFRMMSRRGFAWPTCAEGRVSAPQYEPLAACEKGWSAVSADDSALRDDPLGALCARQRLTGASSACGSDANQCSAIDQRFEIKQRSLRPEPWYVVIDAGQGPQRFYFSLQR